MVDVECSKASESKLSEPDVELPDVSSSPQLSTDPKGKETDANASCEDDAAQEGEKLPSVEEAELRSAEENDDKSNDAEEARKDKGHDDEKTNAEELAPLQTPRTIAPRRGRPAKATPATNDAVTNNADAASTSKRGRKRKGSESQDATPMTGKTPRARTKTVLSYKNFINTEAGDRVLTCGEGESLGHPGRNTTKKPRKVDLIEDEDLKVVQVCAGGVHSVLLTDSGDVYTCGYNEKGTAPGEGVEPDGSTDEFTKINFGAFDPELTQVGKIVMIAAGASFSAALTDKGSVLTWGNLRDDSGNIDVHPLLVEMQKKPVIVVHHKHHNIVKIAAGENHLVMLTDDGKVMTFGDGKEAQLGRKARTDRIRSQYMVSETGQTLIVSIMDSKRRVVTANNIFAGGFWTVVIGNEGQVFTFGLNNFGQLGVPVTEKKSKRAKKIDEDAEKNGDEDDTDYKVRFPTLTTAFEGHEWTHLDGVQHIIARDAEGHVYGIGKNTDNALGLGTWTGNDDEEHWKYDKLQKLDLNDIAGTTARLGSSIAWTKEGDAFSWGIETAGQLGLGLKDDDDMMVPKPQKISSAHLDGYKILSVSLADQHAVFLAKKIDTDTES